MWRKTPGETEEMICSMYNELFPCSVLCNNSSVTAVAIHQVLDRGGGVVRKIIQRFCQGSQHGHHKYEEMSVKHNTEAFAACHFIFFK
jgi:hypothetical protein